ncbi:glycosyltransferase family 4 protein [Flavobacterium sp.]|uniref:glycosyltransferase family 4 protein n=1 Tax=Flavobacterium sp. TaxID=239 RepID=UPI0026195BAC|nr:glycosyltransferase family 4 protein [Flavobacterium sp.]
MRIGLVLPAVPAYSETFFVNKIKGLQSHGHEVVLFLNAKTSLATFEDAPIRTAPSWSKNPIKIIALFLSLLVFHFKAVLKFYQLEQKDQSSFFTIVKRILINSHLLSEKLDWLHFGFGTMALERENIADAIGAKMAVSFRGYDHYVYPLKNKNCYKKLFSKSVKYHVLSEGMKRSLESNGIFKEKIIKITPAIDVDLFSQNQKTKEGTVLEIVTIARLHWIKGLNATLEALALLKQKGIAFHYTIIGDGAEKERLCFAVHQLKLTNEVSFAGKLSPENVKEALKTTDIYLQYSVQEGFCNAVLEAQAMGKLCIVSDAEGLVENVISNETGFVVPKNNPVLLANKIIEIAQISKNEKDLIIEKAITRIKSKFNLPNQIEEFTAFYENY